MSHLLEALYESRPCNDYTILVSVPPKNPTQLIAARHSHDELWSLLYTVCTIL